MAQIAFEWPRRVSYSAEDFIPARSNEAARRFIEGWPAAGNTQWVGVLTGPTGSGKTHLAHIWANRMQAIFLPPHSLGAAPSDTLWQDAPAAILENGDAADEQALFHLVRHAETHARPPLLTMREMAARLPDLRSRLIAAPRGAILPPDEEMLHYFFAKAFADRQWRVDDRVIAYILKRLDRSFAAAGALLAAMERHQSRTKQEITVAAIKSLI